MTAVISSVMVSGCTALQAQDTIRMGNGQMNILRQLRFVTISHHLALIFHPLTDHHCKVGFTSIEHKHPDSQKPATVNFACNRISTVHIELGRQKLASSPHLLNKLIRILLRGDMKPVTSNDHILYSRTPSSDLRPPISNHRPPTNQ